MSPKHKQGEPFILFLICGILACTANRVKEEPKGLKWGWEGGNVLLTLPRKSLEEGEKSGGGRGFSVDLVGCVEYFPYHCSIMFHVAMQ